VNRLALGLALVGLACGGSPAAPEPEAQVTILRQSDTIRFSAPAVMQRCIERPGFLMQALGSGNGVLVWLRTDSPPADSFRVVGLNDSITRPAAVVAVRYISQSIPYTISLDSGSVATRDSAGRVTIRVRGSGLDVRGGTRPGVEASVAALPAPRDSTSCSRAR
jgi:hypothetical protein